MLIFICFILLVPLLKSEDYKPVHKGIPGTFSHKIYLKSSDGVPISPFHDIPFKVVDGVYNMVVEMPRWSNAKNEITKEETLNPIMQDTKIYDGVNTLRYVSNLFPYHGYMWNYGAIPQTWEDPEYVDPNTGVGGDNDPVDVVEIGRNVGYVGEIKQVKILGVIALIDGGETDWKIMSIDINDPMADSLNDIQDVENEMPGLLAASRDFFRNYKVPRGGKYNVFGFEGEWQGREFTEKLLKKTHKKWKELVSRTTKGKIMTENTSINNSPWHISKKEAREILKSNPRYNPDARVPPPESVQHVSFVKRTVSEPVCDAVSDEVGEALPVLPLCNLENN